MRRHIAFQSDTTSGLKRRLRLGWRLFVTFLAVFAAASVCQAADKSSDDQSRPAQAVSAATESDGESSRASDGAGTVDSPSDEPSETPRPLPYDLAPYRIVVATSIGDSIAVRSDSRQQLVNELQRVLSGRLRPLASVAVHHSIPLTDVGLDGLEQIAASAFETDSGPEQRSNLPGKVIGLRLSHTGSGYRVELREWDGTVQTAGPIWERSTLDRRLLPHVVATLLEEVFRPVGLVTEVEAGEVELLMRAGELQQPGERGYSVREGDYLVPFLRYLDRDRNVRRIQPIPWTLLRTTSIDRGYVACKVVSAFGSPLAGSRRRVELVAVRVQPTHAQTRLTIIPRGRPDSPLAGTRVDVLPRLPTDDDPVDEKETLLTDRSGTVVLSGDSQQPLRYVRVFSGKHLLAQVPMLAGIQRQVVLEVPDDSVRLRVEGELSQLEGDLIDIVARRAVLMASMRAAIKQNKPDQFEALDEQLKALPDLDRFERRLRTVRLSALGALQETGDRAAQRNIGRLCDGVLELVRHHLDSDPIRALREEMAELRKATE